MDAMALLQLQGDVEAGLKLVGVGIAAGTAVIGPGAGMGYLIGQTIASIHRQPEAFDQTQDADVPGDWSGGGVRAVWHRVRPPHSLRAHGLLKRFVQGRGQFNRSMRHGLESRPCC